MPTNREKRPRWLMVCKCGATVKASADAAQIAGLRALIYQRREVAVSRDAGTDAVTRAGFAAQIVQEFGASDIGSIDGGTRSQRRSWRALALEQHAPLKGGRAHHRITLENPLA